jgi:general secretion pathway protein H
LGQRPDPTPSLGFTLIEVLVVLAILGVAVGLIALRGAWHSDRTDVRATAETIADALRLTRATAFRTDLAATCRIDPARHLVIAAGHHPFRLSRRATITPTGPVSFGPDGAGDGAAIRVTEGTATQTVTVDWLSGRVTATP